MIQLYTTKTCPYCTNAKQLLKSYKIPFRSRNINDKKWDDLIKKTGQNSVPYVFINSELIGGFRELEMWVNLKFHPYFYNTKDLLAIGKVITDGDMDIHLYHCFKYINDQSRILYMKN